MKKMTALILSLIILSAVPGCSDKAKGSLVSTNPDRSFSSEPESLVRDSEYNYEVREILCENKGKIIYGKAYVPVADGKVPLVIACHGFGTNHEIGEGYAEEYAKHGIALYTFDFCGGSGDGCENLSDGKTTDMSVMTEASDLGEVYLAAKEWDFVDEKRIFFQGGSQGGLVAAIAGIRFRREIAGLILLYPAFDTYDNIHSEFSLGDLPDEFDFEGITVGRKYVEDLWNYDARDHISGFEKPVLILHGSEDDVVPPSYSKEASKLYPNCTFFLISGAEHGFSGRYIGEAGDLALDFIFKNI